VIESTKSVVTKEKKIKQLARKKRALIREAFCVGFRIKFNRRGKMESF